MGTTVWVGGGSCSLCDECVVVIPAVVMPVGEERGFGKTVLHISNERDLRGGLIDRIEESQPFREQNLSVQDKICSVWELNPLDHFKKLPFACHEIMIKYWVVVVETSKVSTVNRLIKIKKI